MDEEIIQNVIWTESAKITFNKIIEYLQQEWGNKEIEKFVNRALELLSTLKSHPEMCRPSAKRKNVRIGILNKQTQLIYYYKPQSKSIKILLFWNTKQDPSRFKY